jgi:hypothetical protein
MHPIHVSEQLYQFAERRAADAGFGSVDDFIADYLQHELEDEAEDLSGFFTPERIAEIDRAAAQADAGQVRTMAEVREHFRRKMTDER